MKVFIPISVLFSGVIFPLGVLLYWFTSNVWTLLQQAYINRYHPPKEKETVEVGSLGKSLAPKPGARPTREARTRPAGKDSAVGDDGASTPPPASANGADGTPGAARSSTPRPGQRPQRPGSKRPPSKRPTQAKKRR
jgi:YidC/Oxa1 family membrane protein insertase